MPVPRYVFVVPYRDRPQQKVFFTTYLTSIIPPTESFEVYFAHQADDRPFNRGAVKNIGFLAVKKKYPLAYRDIRFVFNDVDTIPYAHIIPYGHAPHGTVRHYYGFEYALGGIVEITGGDFEATNGFPGLWGWGMEDRVFQERCERIGLRIDRRQFYPIGDPHILHLFDGVARLVEPREAAGATENRRAPLKDGIRSIRGLALDVLSQSSAPRDNERCAEHDRVFVVNSRAFRTSTEPAGRTFYAYDLRDPVSQILRPDPRTAVAPGTVRLDARRLK
jgi:hypothetical protein